MDMRNEHTAWVRMNMQLRNTAGTSTIDMQHRHGHGTWTRGIRMKNGHAKMDMHDGQAAPMNMQHGQ
jgi:hypothetical protein